MNRVNVWLNYVMAILLFVMSGLLFQSSRLLNRVTAITTEQRAEIDRQEWLLGLRLDVIEWQKKKIEGLERKLDNDQR